MNVTTEMNGHRSPDCKTIWCMKANIKEERANGKNKVCLFLTQKCLIKPVLLPGEEGHTGSIVSLIGSST
jgi:hypothetical protein